MFRKLFYPEMAVGFFIVAGTGFPLSIIFVRPLSAAEALRLGEPETGFSFRTEGANTVGLSERDFRSSMPFFV
jgi:hypothetical protein